MMWLAGIAASVAATWTQPAGAATLELGLGGTAAHELGGAAGLWVGLTDRAEVGTNVAHSALGMLNLHGRATALQGSRSVLGVSAGAMWLDLQRARFLPTLDPDVDDALDGVDVIVVPLGATWSIDGARLGGGLSAGWDLAWATGRPSSEVIILDGAIGARRIWVAPTLRAPLSERLSLRGRAVLPLAARGRTVAVAEYQVSDEVVAGVRSSDWFPLPVSQTTSARLYAQLEGERSTLRLGASTSALFRSLGIPAIPYLLWSRQLGRWW